MINPEDTEIEGAYGDAAIVPFRPLDAYDYLTEPADGMDNVSLEVQFGEDDSRHVSEISSVSYQNLLDDGDVSVSEREARRDSDASEDIDDAGFEPIDLARLDPMNAVITTNDSESPLTSPDDPRPPLGLHPTDPGDGTQRMAEDGGETLRREIRGLVDAGRPQAYENKSSNASHDSTGDVNDIANNVNPNLADVKINYTASHNGTKAKIHKMSPGVARRIIDANEEVAKVQGESVIDKLKSATLQDFLTAHNIRSDIADSQSDKSSSQNSIVAATSTSEKFEIENEYNYVKYARIQQGNSYVGMRLAYSSTTEANVNSGDNHSTRHNGKLHSPESLPEQKQNAFAADDYSRGSGEKGHLNDSNLTEIPLNGTDGHSVDDCRAFSLSSDNLEGDTQEVESIVSDCDKSSLSMPLVEDGLSSSQNSDSDCSHRKLVKRQQRYKRRSLHRDDSDGLRTRELDAQAIMADLKAKREALDSAIMDIKTAIQQSKGVSLKSPSLNSDTHVSEPVWVKRDHYGDNMAYRDVDREEEMRQVTEEVEDVEEDEYARREQERARKEEAKNIKMKSQRMRMRAKASHIPHGPGNLA